MSRRQLESAVGDGGVDAAGVARSRTKCSARAAERSSRTARQLKMMPRARKALEQDRIGPEHADAAAEAAERTSPEEVDDEFGDSIGDQPADPFGKQARSWANAKERLDEQEARHRRQRAASEAISWTNSDGMWCAFLEFDPDTGKAVEKAWQETTDCLWRPDGGRDGTPASPLSGDGAADATRLRGDRPVGVAEFLDGTPLPQSVLERIACNAEFSGIVFETDGSVLWKGRSVRLATNDQWAALIDRDGGCVHCGLDPSM